MDKCITETLCFVPRKHTRLVVACYDLTNMNVLVLSRISGHVLLLTADGWDLCTFERAATGTNGERNESEVSAIDITIPGRRNWSAGASNKTRINAKPQGARLFSLFAPCPLRRM